MSMTTQGKLGSLLDEGLKQLNAYGEYTPTEEEIENKFQELREKIDGKTLTAHGLGEQIARWKEGARQQEEGIAKCDPQHKFRRMAAIHEAALARYKERISKTWKEKVHMLIF